MKTNFRAFSYDTSTSRVTYGAEYNTDITLEPMYRFMLNASEGGTLPYGLTEIRKFDHVRHYNADFSGHLSIVLGIGEEEYTERA